MNGNPRGEVRWTSVWSGVGRSLLDRVRHAQHETRRFSGLDFNHFTATTEGTWKRRIRAKSENLFKAFFFLVLCETDRIFVTNAQYWK